MLKLFLKKNKNVVYDLYQVVNPNPKNSTWLFVMVTVTIFLKFNRIVLFSHVLYNYC